MIDSPLHSAKRTILVGSGPLMCRLQTQIAACRPADIQVIGVVSSAAVACSDQQEYRVIGRLDELHKLVEREQPDLIIVSIDADKRGLVDRQLLEAGMLHDIVVEHAEDVYERLTGKLPIESYQAEHVIYSPEFHPSHWRCSIARLYSLLGAVVGLLVTAPLMLLIALMIKLDSGGSVLFIQERLGLQGRPFKLYKFRTMTPTAEQRSEWEGDNLERITPVGHWLRRYRLDELPQLFNVLKGDMNLVGPRPHPASNFALFVLASRNAASSAAEIPFYSMRSRVLPGITGWAQVRYCYANNLQEEIEKLRFDLYYIKHYSIWLDLRIMAETIGIVVGRKPPAVNPAIAELAADHVEPGPNLEPLGNSLPLKAIAGSVQQAHQPVQQHHDDEIRQANQRV